jgi:hypothetical protein
VIDQTVGAYGPTVYHLILRSWDSALSYYGLVWWLSAVSHPTGNGLGVKRWLVS